MSTHLTKEYELFGELGREGGGAQVWLARERMTGELVALQLRVEPTAPEATRDSATVLRHLGPGVPAGERFCPVCRQTIADWRRYCGQCGTDVASIDYTSTSEIQPADMSLLMGEAARQELDLLGRMRRAEGGGSVFFGRKRTTGQLVALSLQMAAAPTGGGASCTVQTVTFSGGASAPSRASGPATPAAAASITSERMCPSCERVFGPDVRFCSHDGTVLQPISGPDELIGHVIGERYHVLSKIGQGGMGQVYLAEHVKMGRRCAVKVMHRGMSQDMAAVGRFAREAANASRITHPNIATIFDFGETKDHLIYLAMEYVEGEPLSQMMEREHRLPVTRACAIALDIVDALDAAHDQGVVHRDLKPDNILIGRRTDGTQFVKVVDFGIAKAMGANNIGLTQTGLAIGTPRYMSPEQLIADPVDARTDIYSLGVVLFEMLVGESPVAGPDGTYRITSRLTEAPPSARGRNADIPEALDAVVSKLLARAPEDRYQNADIVRDALKAALAAPSAPVAATAPAPDRAVAAPVVPPVDAPASAHRRADAPASAHRRAERVGPDRGPLVDPAAATAGPANAPPRPTRPATAVSVSPASPLSRPAARVSLVAAFVVVLGGGIVWTTRDRPPTQSTPPAPANLEPGASLADAATGRTSGTASGANDVTTVAPATPAPAGITAARSTPERASGSEPTPTAQRRAGADPAAASGATSGRGGATAQTQAGRTAPLGTVATDRTAGRSGNAVEPDRTAAPPVTRPVAEVTTPPAVPFPDFAASEIRRFRAAVESRDMDRVRATFRRGGLSADLETELRQTLTGASALTVAVDNILASADSRQVPFQLRIFAGAETVFNSWLVAEFLQPTETTWVMTLIRRR